MWLYWIGYVASFLWFANGLLSELEQHKRAESADSRPPPLVDFGATALILAQVAVFSFFWPIALPYFLYTRHAERREIEEKKRTHERVLRMLRESADSREANRKQ